MMTHRPNVVAALVAAAGGELAGKTRLRAAAYLLDRLGLNSGFFYDYDCCVFSVDLNDSLDFARVVFGLIDKEARPSPDGTLYGVYRLTGSVDPEAYGDLGEERARELMTLIVSAPCHVLDLATAIDWIWRMERSPNWRREIQIRKTIFAQDQDIEKAVALLRQMGLEPPTTP